MNINDLNAAFDSAEKSPGEHVPVLEDVEIDGELPHAYDLLYDIKTHKQLQNEVEFLAHRLAGIAELCRRDGHPIDGYLQSVLMLQGQAENQ